MRTFGDGNNSRLLCLGSWYPAGLLEYSCKQVWIMFWLQRLPLGSRPPFWAWLTRSSNIPSDANGNSFLNETLIFSSAFTSDFRFSLCSFLVVNVIFNMFCRSLCGHWASMPYCTLEILSVLSAYLFYSWTLFPPYETLNKLLIVSFQFHGRFPFFLRFCK